METGALRQLLNNICTNSQWFYAVFWKLQQFDYHKILTSEEVYCDSEKGQQSCERILIDPYIMQEAFGFGTNASCECDAPPFGYPIAAAVADISCCQYLLGEGMVGRAALADNDFWIYSDDIESTELLSNLGYGDEWFLPIISTGVKTTLLASVLPYGVVQLGSFEKVAENQVLSADIRDKFYTLNSNSNFNNNHHLLYSILIPQSQNNTDDEHNITNLQSQEDDDDSTAIHTPEFIHNTDFHFPTVYDQLVPLMDNNNEHNHLEMEDLSFFIDEQDIHHLDIEISNNNIESDNVPNEFITADDNDNNITTPEETEMWIHELQRAFGPDFSRECYELQQQQQQGDLFESFFPKDCELHLYKENSAWSNLGFDSLKMETCGIGIGIGIGPLFDEDDEKELLNNDNLDDDTSGNFYQCNTSKSSVTSLTEHGVTCDVANNTAVLANESVFANGMPSPRSLESLESATVEHEQASYEKSLKPESRDSKRGKEKPKSKNRPRPRDRQLIQDRLKELRNLIPDSEKCSIDGLLDQTMKHMTFLKSVTERAEKVKNFVGEEEVDYSSTKRQKNNSHPSFGLESNYEACPIIMKDMEHPSQFLIQMICSDEGVFYEIAEVMHKLKLTILKGVMENRRNKWACFIVEASKGFNRLDIFWPLMRILQQQGNWLVTDQCIN